VALYLAERKDCLMVGDMQTGYIIVPHGVRLCAELNAAATRRPLNGYERSKWILLE
jgi:predicted RNase H-like nuclease